MEIKKVYKTSKGLFWTKEEAEKKKNRAKNSDPHYSGMSLEDRYEPVREAYVLFTWKDQDYCIHRCGMMFELNPVEVQ